MNKLQQLAPISTVWAVSDQFADRAIALLEGLDVTDCARQQAAHMEKVEAAKARRKDELGDKYKPYDMAGSTAILALSGPITKKPTSASWLFGGVASIETRALLRQMKADEDVSNVLLIWESPGGEVAGLFELAADLRALNEVKPVTSYFEDEAASAAYYVPAAGSSRLLINQMGWCGCIGTILGVVDSSAAAAQGGFKVKQYKTGPYKGAGARGTAIEPHHDAYFQSIVDHHFEDFKAQVMGGRGMTEEQFAAVSDGRMFTADDALSLGLVDGICSLDECIASVSADGQKLTAGKSRQPAASAAPDKAPASADTAKEHDMNLSLVAKKAIASLLGKPEALAEAGITEAEAKQALTEVANDDPRVAEALKNIEAKQAATDAALAEMKSGWLGTAAEAFADDVIMVQHKADPKQRESLITQFKGSAKLDGKDGEAVFADGKLVEGENLAAFRKDIAARQEIPLAARIPDRDPKAGNDGKKPEFTMADVVRASVAATNGPRRGIK